MRPEQNFPWPAGVGIGWRPALSDLLVELAGQHRLGFSEVIAESIPTKNSFEGSTEHPLPPGVRALRTAGVPVIPHGVSLGLAGAQRPDPARLATLAGAALALQAPLVSEHVAFVRAGGPGLHSDVLEAGHLVPGPRTRESLEVLVENVREAMDALPVPLALENPASTLPWPEDEIDEPDFLTELVERTGCWLLLDLANIEVSCRTNRQVGGGLPDDAQTWLRRMPLHRVAYAHVAGGVEHDGVYLDSHAHDLTQPVLDLVTSLHDLAPTVGVLIERDDNLSVANSRAEWELVDAALHTAHPTGEQR